MADCFDEAIGVRAPIGCQLAARSAASPARSQAGTG